MENPPTSAAELDSDPDSPHLDQFSLLWWSTAVSTGPAASLTAQPSAPSWRSTTWKKREACRSRSYPWLLTGITEQGNGNLSTSFLGGIPRCSRLCSWENGRNACVKHCFVVHLRSLSTHSSICFYFAVAVLHSGQPGFQLLLVRSSFFVW